MVQDETADGLRGGERAAPAAMQASAQAATQGSATRQGLGPQARKRIGTHLRALYDSVLQQPVPDRFAALIAGLDDSAPPAKAGE